MGIIQPKKKQNLNNELKFRTTRVRVFVWIGKDKKPIVGYAFVNEVKKKAVAALLSRKLPAADIVMIAFDSEESQPYRAKVVGNQSKHDQKNLQSTEADWRVSFQFEFASEPEAKRYIDYYLDLRQRTAMFARDVKQSNYSIVENKNDGIEGLDEAIADIDDEGNKGAA